MVGRWWLILRVGHGVHTENGHGSGGGGVGGVCGVGGCGVCVGRGETNCTI